MGIISYQSYQHTFSPHAVADIHAIIRNNANGFYSNADSTPVILTQHNWFREGYVRRSFTLDRGRSEWKAGFESDNTLISLL